MTSEEHKPPSSEMINPLGSESDTQEEAIIEALGPPELPLLRRINVGIDQAIRSLVFEFVDGSRRGLCLNNNNEPLVGLSDENISNVGGDWVDIDYGDFIISVSGNHLNQGRFLCHSILLSFRSGRVLSFESHHKHWSGESFHFEIADTKLVTNLVFVANGMLQGIGVITTTMHLPISIDSVSQLPRQIQNRLRLILMAFNMTNTLPLAVSWRILSFLNGFQIVHGDELAGIRNGE
mmetsp:Transcript_18327/g.26758  ORF Transcript_18327/g.26758 Transcript_18327/m.26758 type:complete len:236 (+) Transcript_18327:203-910(+)